MKSWNTFKKWCKIAPFCVILLPQVFYLELYLHIRIHSVLSDKRYSFILFSLPLKREREREERSFREGEREREEYIERYRGGKMTQKGAILHRKKKAPQEMKSWNTFKKWCKIAPFCAISPPLGLDQDFCQGCVYILYSIKDYLLCFSFFLQKERNKIK